MLINDEKNAIIEIGKDEAKKIMQALVDIHEGCYAAGELAYLYELLRDIAES